MKMNPFTNNVTKAVSAFMMTVVLSVGFSACSDKDVTAPDIPGGGGIPAQLIGTWYGDYSSQGEITESAPGTREGVYVRAVQGLKFNADGTGTCYKYLCDLAGDPISIYGGSMDPQNGQFHFTVKDDSVVTIVRDGEGDSQHPKTWMVVNGRNGLRGTDGATEYSMQTATAEQQGWLSDWEQLLRRGANNDESSDDFLRGWENAETVCLSTYGTRNLPWYGAANNDIPENIRFDMKKRDGWEMAFCMLNDPNSPNVHMFGLYNRFTGVLRLYQYVENASGYGKELYVNLVNDSYSKYRYPFYNSMAYSIPVNRVWGETLKKDAELITYGNSYKPFEYLLSAYTRYGEAKGVAPNWHCVDLDTLALAPLYERSLEAGYHTFIVVAISKGCTIVVLRCAPSKQVYLVGRIAGLGHVGIAFHRVLRGGQRPVVFIAPTIQIALGEVHLLVGCYRELSRQRSRIFARCIDDGNGAVETFAAVFVDRLRLHHHGRSRRHIFLGVLHLAFRQIDGSPLLYLIRSNHLHLLHTEVTASGLVVAYVQHTVLPRLFSSLLRCLAIGLCVVVGFGHHLGHLRFVGVLHFVALVVVEGFLKFLVRQLRSVFNIFEVGDA